MLTALHQAIGLLNTGIGICRILDVVFVLYRTSKQSRSVKNKEAIGLRGPWNVLASFMGITVGIITMAANEEQAEMLNKCGIRMTTLFMAVAAVGISVMGCK